MSFSLSDVGWGFAPDPTGELTAPHRPNIWFQGGGGHLTSGRGREDHGDGAEGGGGKGRDGEERG